LSEAVFFGQRKARIEGLDRNLAPDHGIMPEIDAAYCAATEFTSDVKATDAADRGAVRHQGRGRRNHDGKSMPGSVKFGKELCWIKSKIRCFSMLQLEAFCCDDRLSVNAA
jgi:hypothetical protein